MKQILFSLLLIVSGSTLVACQPPSTPSAANEPTSTPPDSRASFNSAIYLLANPDVAKQIETGQFKSALEQYEKVGQSSKNDEGEPIQGFFTGTAGNDMVTGFGQAPGITGVNFEVVAGKEGAFPMRPINTGIGEVDTLIATKGSSNEFLLGSFITSVNPQAEPFYVGKGDADYARIQNFTQMKDSISLAGQPNQYKFESEGGNFRILTANGDLVAIVEGIDRLEPGEISPEFGMFVLK